MAVQGVKRGRTARRVASVTAGLALTGIVAWAWIDGGREPLREMAEPVAVPERAR